MKRTAALIVFVLAAGLPLPASVQDLDRPGKGEWCYDPVRAVNEADRRSFLAEIGPAAIAAERRYGVPGPIVAGMAIIESGYGLTRLALKANNVLAFKWPGSALSRGAAPFTLRCQPDWDSGNVYPAFRSRADCIDFVAWRLKESRHYAAATARYAQRIATGGEVRAAAIEWLHAIAPAYNYNPTKYVRDVLAIVTSPVPGSSQTLWELYP